jgi:hypothetical protein
MFAELQEDFGEEEVVAVRFVALEIDRLASYSLATSANFIGV